MSPTIKDNISIFQFKKNVLKNTSDEDLRAIIAVNLHCCCTCYQGIFDYSVNLFHGNIQFRSEMPKDAKLNGHVLRTVQL